VLKAERELDLKLYPERCDHIWEGGYATAFEGAYFAAALAKAKDEAAYWAVSRPIRYCRSRPTSTSAARERG
jgi:phage terminase large subunit